MYLYISSRENPASEFNPGAVELFPVHPPRGRRLVLQPRGLRSAATDPPFVCAVARARLVVVQRRGAVEAGGVVGPLQGVVEPVAGRRARGVRVVCDALEPHVLLRADPRVVGAVVADGAVEQHARGHAAARGNGGGGGRQRGGGGELEHLGRRAGERGGRGGAARCFYERSPGDLSEIYQRSIEPCRKTHGSPLQNTG